MNEVDNAEDVKSDFDVKDRIHIAPLGFEKERVYLAASAMKADRVIIISYEDDNEGDEYLEEVIEGLSELNIDYETASCNIFDLYDSIGEIAEQVHQYNSEEVFVNVSTGGKITAIAGMIACMVTEATPYYVQAEDYESGIPKGVRAIKRLPRYPIEAPDKQNIVMLDYIYRENMSGKKPTKKELIEYAVKEELPFVAGQDTENKRNYRLLDKHIIDPLQKEGHISVKKTGRKKRVTITQSGEKTRNAFRYMLEDTDFETRSPSQQSIEDFEI